MINLFHTWPIDSRILSQLASAQYCRDRDRIEICAICWTYLGCEFLLQEGWSETLSLIHSNRMIVYFFIGSFWLLIWSVGLLIGSLWLWIGSSLLLTGSVGLEIVSVGLLIGFSGLLNVPHWPLCLLWSWSYFFLLSFYFSPFSLVRSSTHQLFLSHLRECNHFHLQCFR